MALEESPREIKEKVKNSSGLTENIREDIREYLIKVCITHPQIKFNHFTAAELIVELKIKGSFGEGLVEINYNSLLKEVDSTKYFIKKYDCHGELTPDMKKEIASYLILGFTKVSGEKPDFRIHRGKKSYTAIEIIAELVKGEGEVYERLVSGRYKRIQEQLKSAK